MGNCRHMTDWTLIARYVTENASPEDRRSVLNWTLQDRQNQDKLDEVVKIWKHSGTRVPPPVMELEMEWAELQRRIEDQESPGATDKKKKALKSIIKIL